MILRLITVIAVVAVIAWLLLPDRTIFRVIVGVAVMAIPAWTMLAYYTANLVCQHPLADFARVEVQIFLDSRYVDDPMCAAAKRRFLGL